MISDVKWFINMCCTHFAQMLSRSLVRRCRGRNTWVDSITISKWFGMLDHVNNGLHWRELFWRIFGISFSIPILFTVNRFLSTSLKNNQTQILHQFRRTLCISGLWCLAQKHCVQLGVKSFICLCTTNWAFEVSWYVILSLITITNLVIWILSSLEAPLLQTSLEAFEETTKVSFLLDCLYFPYL